MAKQIFKIDDFDYDVGKKKKTLKYDKVLVISIENYSGILTEHLFVYKAWSERTRMDSRRSNRNGFYVILT